MAVGEGEGDGEVSAHVLISRWPGLASGNAAKAEAIKTAGLVAVSNILTMFFIGVIMNAGPGPIWEFEAVGRGLGKELAMEWRLMRNYRRRPGCC